MPCPEIKLSLAPFLGRTTDTLPCVKCSQLKVASKNAGPLKPGDSSQHKPLTPWPSRTKPTPAGCIYTRAGRHSTYLLHTLHYCIPKAPNQPFHPRDGIPVDKRKHRPAACSEFEGCTSTMLIILYVPTSYVSNKMKW